jgi:hypothetical protein
MLFVIMASVGMLLEKMIGPMVITIIKVSISSLSNRWPERIIILFSYHIL